MDSTENPTDTGRRSTRIRAQIPIRVTSLDPATPFSESGHTLVVNTQGCGVRLSRALEPGLAVSLDEIPAGSVTARIANCVPLGSGGQWWMVGIALDEAGNVWGVHPTPADWGTDAAIAAAAGATGSATSPAKSGEWPFRQFSSRGEFHPGKR
jgi:hypothetical protein